MFSDFIIRITNDVGYCVFIIVEMMVLLMAFIPLFVLFKDLIWQSRSMENKIKILSKNEKYKRILGHNFKKLYNNIFECKDCKIQLEISLWDYPRDVRAYQNKDSYIDLFPDSFLKRYNGTPSCGEIMMRDIL
jgi:hypothetical protein